MTPKFCFWSNWHLTNSFLLYFRTHVILHLNGYKFLCHFSNHLYSLIKSSQFIAINSIFCYLPRFLVLFSKLWTLLCSSSLCHLYRYYMWWVTTKCLHSEAHISLPMYFYLLSLVSTLHPWKKKIVFLVF